MIYLGYIGLNNNKFRCYINSVIQCFFHTKVVQNKISQLQVNTLNLNENDKNFLLELQSFFFKLQVCYYEKINF